MTGKTEKQETKPKQTTQERVVAKVKAMTLDQRFKLLQSAGIYTKAGNLTARYKAA